MLVKQSMPKLYDYQRIELCVERNPDLVLRWNIDRRQGLDQMVRCFNILVVARRAFYVLLLLS